MKKIKKIIASSLLGLSLLSFTACATSSAVETAVSGVIIGVSAYKAVSAVSKAMEVFTPEQEYTIGLSVANAICKIYTPVPLSDATDYVNKICTTITINSDMAYLYKGYHVIIANSEDINALSTPGGHIFITTGLLKSCSSEDELAAVIAHEIAHVQLKHSIKSIKSKRTAKAVESVVDLTDAVDSVVSGDWKAGKEMEDNTSNLTKTLFQSGFSKEQEFDADKLAVKLLFDAGYNPMAMNDMFNHLEEERVKSEQKKHFAREAFYVARTINRIMKNEITEEEYKSLNRTHPKPKTRMKKVNKIIPEYMGMNADFYDSARTQRFEANRVLF